MLRFDDSNLPDPTAYLALFETTGWNQAYQINAQQLAAALCESWYCLSAYEDGQLVGFGRIVSDGLLYAMIYEMIVEPSYQGRGIGSAILQKLLAHCKQNEIRDIQLFSAAGKSTFYEGHGFEARPIDAPGMRYCG